jgi:hypothetical protein
MSYAMMRRPPATHAGAPARALSPERKLEPAHGENDKQFRVESDVRVAAVTGHVAWMGHNDGSISIRKVRTTELVHTLPANSQRGRPWAMLVVQPVDKVASPTVWVGYSTGDLEIFDARTRRSMKLLCRHTGGVYALSEFNGQVFSGSSDFEIVQWDARTATFVRQLTGHTNYVRALHAEGSLLISGSDDMTVRIWNTVSGQLVSIGRFHTAGVASLCRVGATVWTGDDSGKISVWKLTTLELEDTLAEHGGRVSVIKKIGSRVYTGSADHTVGVWDAVTRLLMARISEHRGWVLSVACPAQLTRHYVWTTAADSSVRCWHHDEYKVSTRDVERFNDVQWFETEYSPYHELNCELTTTVRALEEQAEGLRAAYGQDHGLLTTYTTEVVRMKEATAAAEEECLQAREQVRRCDAQLALLAEARDRKERELVQLSGDTKAMREANVDLRCTLEASKVEAEELRRQLALVAGERDKLSLALTETLALRTAKGDPPPVIVTTTDDASQRLIVAQQQLRETLALNEALRGDLARASATVAAATTTSVVAAVSSRKQYPGISSPMREQRPAARAPQQQRAGADSGLFSVTHHQARQPQSRREVRDRRATIRDSIMQRYVDAANAKK